MGELCHCRGRTLPLPWHCIATAVGELCHRSDTALLPQRENFATAVAMQCYCGGGKTEMVTSFTGLLPIENSLLYEFEEKICHSVMDAFKSLFDSLL